MKMALPLLVLSAIWPWWLVEWLGLGAVDAPAEKTWVCCAPCCYYECLPPADPSDPNCTSTTRYCCTRCCE